jgi:hypothetical protein
MLPVEKRSRFQSSTRRLASSNPGEAGTGASLDIADPHVTASELKNLPAMIRSLFIIAASGEVIIEKHYRGVVSRAICDVFWEEVAKHRLCEVGALRRRRVCVCAVAHAHRNMGSIGCRVRHATCG